jgi:hypothetical protein
MANKDDNLGRTVATAELVETIKNKLGITRPIEEFVESYNRTLPIGFPIFLMNIAPLWQSEDRSKYPECAKNVFFPWYDILAYMFSKHKHLPLSERTCPDCGERMVVFHYTSPVWSWNSLCGRAGFMTICPSCPKQVDFVLTLMN